MVIGYDAWLALVSHPLVIERFMYSQAAIIDEPEILRVLARFEITNILVGTAQGTPDGPREL